MDKRALRQAVRSRLGVNETIGDGLVEHTNIDDAIAGALRDITDENDWPWLLTSATLTFTGNAAPWPSDFKSARLFTVGNPATPVERVSLEQFLSQQYMCVWTESGTGVMVYPTPTATLTTPTLWYYRYEPDLTTDTQSPLLPAAHHELIVVRASWKINVRRGDSKRAAADDAEWQAGMRRLQHSRWAVQGPRRIQSAFRVRNQARWT